MAGVNDSWVSFIILMQSRPNLPYLEYDIGGSKLILTDLKTNENLQKYVNLELNQYVPL